MGTSMGAAIDYLVDKFTNGITGTNAAGQPVTYAGLSSVDKYVEVADGKTLTSDSPWVTVGCSGPNQDTDVSITADYMVLGRQRIDESYSIPCEVIQYGPEEQQAATRAACVALFDRCVQIVWADPTLGGLIKNGKIAHIARATLSQPQPERGDGTAAMIQFSVDVENAYIP
jgi:hypothetical protein